MDAETFNDIIMYYGGTFDGWKEAPDRKSAAMMSERTSLLQPAVQTSVNVAVDVFIMPSVLVSSKFLVEMHKRSKIPIRVFSA